MALKLLCKKIFKTCFFLVFLFGSFAQISYGQSLSSGDIAFTGFKVEDSDGFAVVFFESVAGEQEIHFSEGPWLGNSFGNEAGNFTWNSPAGGISAGTVLSFRDLNSTPSVNIGSITDATKINLLGSGSVIFAYTGTDKDTPNTPMLGAISNSIDHYNGTQGTLSGTGLTQNVDAILLNAVTGGQQFGGDRSRNTKSGYRKKLNKDGKWEEADGSSNQASKVFPFDTESFRIVSAPTVAFSSAKLTSTEGSTILLIVKLLESTASPVDVDISFLSDVSTASSADLDNYTNTKVSFGSGAVDGTKQGVSITLSEDNNFEGDEKAVFGLRNNTSGSLVKPDVMTLTIADNDSPKIVINEFLADPTAGSDGDANGDGIRDGVDDEFIEIINSETKEIDISGWQLSNDGGNNITYTFPEGTILPAGRAIVVFGGGSPSGQFGSAFVHTASNLSLTNSYGQVTLLDKSGTVVDNIAYEKETENGQSITRAPDETGEGIPHSQVSDSNGELFSPGTKVDGSSFTSGHVVALRGNEGWRMISSPGQGTTFEDLIGDLWVQGFSGSDELSGTGSIFSWSEKNGGAFATPSSMSSSLEVGKGYIVYVFEDDELNTSGIQGGFPKFISSDNIDNNRTVNVPVSAHDADEQNGIDGNEGWNLLGNPFGTDISVDALFSALEAAGMVNTNIYVWDNNKSGGADYVELSKGDGERLAPYQAFWVRYMQDGIDTEVILDKDNLMPNGSTNYYKKESEDSFQFGLELHGTEKFDTYHLEFNDLGAIDSDRFDGYHLFSLDPSSINFYSMLNSNRLQKNVLPRSLDANLNIPLYFEAGSREKLILRWKKLKGVPEDWEFILVDEMENREINLRTTNTYEFTNYNVGDAQKINQKEKLLNKGKVKSESDARFTLKVQPNSQGLSSGEMPNSAKLNPNYPNPFNPTTTISYELTKDAEVTLTVWNMIGQKVATLIDGPAEAGRNEVSWNASSMPSGIYIARFEVGGKVYTRKMTLIK
ncbi:lamin tail domain-containing protein [Fodinibius saliphilus]|uniref:lamin tail domain-containing protein n=1 Tax=Fodinibius saliphilus TaxID=1920650 RepID=UPI0011093EC1|nr:lamin tail domain-containing protein [Fodinibius saliphilus]